MRAGNGADGIVIQQFGRIAAPAQGIPALDNNPLLLNERYNVLFLIIRVDFILHQRGRDRNLGQKRVQLFNVPVGKTQRTDFALLHIALHGLVSLHIIRARMMQQHHIDIADIQLFQRHVDGCLRIVKLVRVNLRDHKDFLSCDPVLLHGLAHALANGVLVSVHVCRVDQAPTVLKKCLDRIDAGIIIQRIGAESEDRHFITAVEQHCFRFKIKLSDHLCFFLLSSGTSIAGSLRCLRLPCRAAESEAEHQQCSRQNSMYDFFPFHSLPPSIVLGFADQPGRPTISPFSRVSYI